MKSLAIVITHPIQYYVPVFKLLAKSCHLKVFYTWGEAGAGPKYDPDFKKEIAWDIPLLEGYSYEFLYNSSKNPGSHHFNGIKNPEIESQINKFNPDAILIYGWSYASHLKVLRKFKNKVSLWFRGDSTNLNHSKKLKSIFRNLFLKWVYSHVDIAFYVGTANKEYFKSNGLNENQLLFAPHAVDNQRFSEDENLEVANFRNKLNLKKNDKIILFAGKLEPRKNPLLLLSAFQELNPDIIENWKLIFVGDGQLIDSLKKNSKQNKNIIFHPFVNQKYMSVVIQSCSLFCLPSDSETWGLVVNEAMAASKAILVSDKVGCAYDLVKPGVNGYIFESGNKADLLQKLSNLINFENLDQFGKNSLEIIKNWSIENQAQTILNKLYEGD